MFMIVLAVAQVSSADNTNGDRIQPWSQNPRYWQYKGQPVMLVGGSKTDHFFLLDDLREHVDEVRAAGANYVRNTMSQREGKELKPHKLLPDGKFDLDQWNEEYWQRFQNMLQWTAEREIIVQIEVWDRFDYADEGIICWQTSPWNPKNNINYAKGQADFFAETYAKGEIYRDEHPFFHTIKGTSHYQSRYDFLRKYQESFVAKMLSYSLPYGHVLYCMNNETSSEEKWGQYWMTFIRNRAAQQGVTVFCTDMFDDVWTPQKSAKLRQAFDDPQMYPFLDVSQVNSRSYDDGHWENVLWIAQQREAQPRPMNHTKIYGSGYARFGTGGPEDGIERFWRDILGGSASARFHRPDSGNGLNDLAKASIQAARLLEQRIKFWEVTPHMELLSDREPNEAYLAAKPGESYALYLTNGGSVTLDLSRAPSTFEITWISVSMGRVVQNSQSNGYQRHEKTLEGGRAVSLTAPFKGGWVAALVRK